MNNTSNLLANGAGASELVNVICDGIGITRRPGLVPADGVTFDAVNYSAVLGKVRYRVMDAGALWAWGPDAVQHSVLTTPGGAFRSIKEEGGSLFVEVKREGAMRAERFDPDAYTDTAADGSPLPFSHIIVPLPPSVQGAGAETRLIRACFRLLDTRAMRVDTGRGLSQIPFRRFGKNVLDDAPPPFSGDVQVRAIGWRRAATIPLWRIEQDDPQPFTLLKVLTEWKDVA